ncbi:MAG TPA: RNA methyltransferase [Candidatus Acidoferrales bacterium]|nr:RNA methyltransferase [Candidatus Acidoferrales bacterium]
MPREGISSVTDAAAARVVRDRRPGPDSGPEIIRSRDNKRLKAFRASLRGSGPAAGEPIAVEGPKLVEEGLRAGLELDALLVSEAGEAHLDRIFAVARETEDGVPRSRIFRTTDKLFAGVTATETPQGIAALFRQREWAFEDVLRGTALQDGSFRGDPAFVIVLVGVQDPGNVGTIIRSAEAFGATGVICVRGTADPWSPKGVRASAGSALRLPLLRGIAPTVALVQLRTAGLKIYAAVSGTKGRRADGDRQPKQLEQRDDSATLAANLADRCAILIGSEGHGLPPELERAADAIISVPISEPVDSLNAAVAASVLLYEAARQRRAAS